MRSRDEGKQRSFQATAMARLGKHGSPGEAEPRRGWGPAKSGRIWSGRIRFQRRRGRAAKAADAAVAVPCQRERDEHGRGRRRWKKGEGRGRGLVAEVANGEVAGGAGGARVRAWKKLGRRGSGGAGERRRGSGPDGLERASDGLRRAAATGGDRAVARVVAGRWWRPSGGGAVWGRRARARVPFLAGEDLRK